MNRIISFLLICILFASCTSSRKMVIRGFYDQAISKATYKLKKHPTKEKQINALNDAYRLANQINNDKIKFLRQEGKPDNWNEIYLNYTSLQNRQNIVKTLPQSVLNRINFSFIDYDKEIIASKQKAVDYSYAHAMELLKKNTKSDARKSYDELMLVKNYSQNYKDVDAQIQNAISNGRTYILFKMQNKTMIPLPEKFEEELLKISLSEYNSLWQTFDTKAVDGKKYDYVVLANIKNIEIGPESVKEREYTETKVVDCKGVVQSSRLFVPRRSDQCPRCDQRAQDRDGFEPCLCKTDRGYGCQFLKYLNELDVTKIPPHNIFCKTSYPFHQHRSQLIYDYHVYKYENFYLI